MSYTVFMPGAYWFGPICLSVLLAYGQEDLEMLFIMQSHKITAS